MALLPPFTRRPSCKTPTHLFKKSIQPSTKSALPSLQVHWSPGHGKSLPWRTRPCRRLYRNILFPSSCKFTGRGLLPCSCGCIGRHLCVSISNHFPYAIGMCSLSGLTSWTGDMAMAGPYYSPFLLTVLCAHAARFDDSRLSDALISRARLLLGNEIHQASSIPTAQALLQLSARDLAYGSISQAWLYSGMAFRMVSDLGLHHSTGRIAKVGGLHPQDLEIRRRLFWSCYFWDKAISLYLGRTPVLQDLPSDHTPEFRKCILHST